MASVLLVGDERKGGTRAAIDDVARWLDRRGCHARTVTDREASLEQERADLVVVFGGDGSILAAARRMGRNQMPTLGINIGRLGFLTAFGYDEVRTGIERALAGDLVEEPRLMLACHVRRADGSRSESVLCLNDGVLVRAATAGIVVVAALRRERELATYSGDGVIVATPVGSTAYSLAAGGPIVTPNMEALVLTPLASHTLTVRPLVVPEDEGLDLEVREDGGGGYCPFVIDGQVYLRVAPGERACLRPADVAFRHLTRGPQGFFDTLREKFGWADTPRHPPPAESSTRAEDA